ncbi:radical SAM protein [Fundidesulfovibrio agrisoli]|uniref:radical SAM protein n=1 Tax=Fundidesulfovibrio agrisoli TaxID=2922717 RepID=UPI001FAC5531
MKSRQEYAAIRAREAANKAYYAREDGVAAAPHTVCLSVNTNCFMRCRMCDIGVANAAKSPPGEARLFSGRYSRPGRQREFPLERALALVDELAPHGPTIKTNFVEPLLWSGLERLARYAKSKGLPFYTITNGWTLARHAGWIADAGVDLVRVSIDGPPQVHDRLRGVPGSHARAVAGLKALVAAKKNLGAERPILGVCCTVSDHNCRHLLPMLRGLREEGLLEHCYVNINHLQYTTQWEAQLSREQSPLLAQASPCSLDGVDLAAIDLPALAEQAALIATEFPAGEYNVYFSPRLEAEDLAAYYDPKAWMFPGTPCYLPWYAAQLDMDGNVGVYGHCVLPGFGSVLEQGGHRGFMDVWNSERAREVRLALKRAGSFAACNRCIGTLYPLRGRD